MTTNVRIQAKAYEKLREMAHAAGTTMPQALTEAIDARYRKWLLEGLAEDYRKLRADPKAWTEELKERALWDQTLLDGLEDKQS